MNEAARPTVADDAEYIEQLKTALRFYAHGAHFHADPDTLDSVSGEPPNWLCNDADEPMALTLEDGGIARMALQGLRLQWLDGDEDITPAPLDNERRADGPHT